MDKEARVQLAASALVGAAGTDGWEALQPRVISWFGQGSPARKPSMAPRTRTHERPGR